MKTSGEIKILSKKHITGELKSNQVYVGRGNGSMLGNPFSHLPNAEELGLCKTDTVEEAVDLYLQWLRKRYKDNRPIKAAIDKLVERYKAGEQLELVCWCAPKEGWTIESKPWKCHGQVIAHAIITLASQQ